MLSFCAEVFTLDGAISVTRASGSIVHSRFIQLKLLDNRFLDLEFIWNKTFQSSSMNIITFSVYMHTY